MLGYPLMIVNIDLKGFSSEYNLLIIYITLCIQSMVDSYPSLVKRIV